MKRPILSISSTVLPLASIAIFLCALPISSAQSLPRKPLSEGHLEHYDNPPAFLRRPLQVSPGMVSPFGPYTSYQVNVDANGNNLLGDAANEPSICVDPTNHNRMAIAWRQFDSVTSNFRQAGWAYTTNGGVNWTFPGVLQPNVFRSDPVLNSDSTGQFYYLSLLDSFFDDIWRSLTGGQSWTDLAPATGGDKEWFMIDNTNSAGHGFQYQCWSTAGNNYAGRQFSRSTDGGLSWRDPVAIPHTPIWGTPDVDSTGNLFIGGVNPGTGQIWCVRSTNAKDAAAKPTFDQSTVVNLGGDIIASGSINPEGLVGQIFLAVDRSGTGTNNNIYLLASVERTGFNTGSDVMFVRSTDGGQSFSSPVRINDDPVNPNKWHWFGALSVAPNGRLDCVWLDTRNALNNTDSQLFYSSSNDGGITWTPNVPVSNSFNPYLGYPNQDKMGDYITVVSDNTGADVAYSATFNGEEDIYYVRIPALMCDLPMEGFDSAALADWLMKNNSEPPGSTGWFQGDNTVFAAQSGASTSYIAADYNNTGDTNTISNWLFTPPVTLQNGRELTFYTRTIDKPNHPDRLQVRMSVKGDSTNVGSTAASVGDFTTLLLDINPAYTVAGYPNKWTQYSVTVSGLAAPTTGRFAFRYFVEDGGTGARSVNSDYIGIDTVQLGCPAVYTISVSASPVSAGLLTGGGNYSNGSSVTVTATGNAGYTFANWTENGSVVSSSPSYTFTASADRSLIANFTSVPRTTATPAISPSGGTFKKKVKFKLSCATLGATIYYTTDGSDPTTASPVYPVATGKKKKVKGIVIKGKGLHTVKAMATAPGYIDSAIAVAVFTIK